MNKNVIFKDLGLINFTEAFAYQEKIFIKKVEAKSSVSNNDDEKHEEVADYLLFCEHPHVFTLGKSGSEENLLVNTIALKNKKAEFFKTNRGGDITYHGPGQIVGYPILNLENYVSGTKQYIYMLEQSIIDCLKIYDIIGERLDGATGVWIDVNKQNKTRKICAIGVRTSRWVAMHGFAFNVNTDLEYFNMINPCGYTDKAVTSLEKELGYKLNIEQVKQNLLKCIVNCFKMKILFF